MAAAFFAAALNEAHHRHLILHKHFTVAVTLPDSRASMKNCKPNAAAATGGTDSGGVPPPTGGSGGRNREVDFYAR